MLIYINSLEYVILRQETIMLVVYWSQISILGVISAFLLYYYSDPKAALYAKILVFLSFFVSLLCFVILPIDIYQSSLETSDYQGQLQKSWVIIYYINFFMCWLILPFAQEYQDSGEFSFSKKIKESLIINAILIGILCVGAVAIVIYLLLASQFTIGQLPGVFATLVNVFGLSLVSIFMGYGLISFPKEFYQRRDYKTIVNRCHRQAECLKSEQETILEEIYTINQILEGPGERNDSEVRVVTDLISENFVFTRTLFQCQHSSKLKKKSTADLHKIVKKRLLQKNACGSRLDELVDDLKGITQSYLNNNYIYKKIVYSLLFFATTAISCLIFVAELSTFATFLSPINLLGLMGWGGQIAYFFNLFFCIYIAQMVVSSVFRVKVYKIFALHRGHSTASSLLFSAINLSRICYPLCFNYEQITDQPDSSFLSFFGQVNINPKYTIIFPILMLLFALFNVFDIYDRVAGYLGLSSWAFDEEEAQEKKEEGRNILIERFKERNEQSNQMEMIQLL